jgi:hypothetical protein
VGHRPAKDAVLIWSGDDPSPSQTPPWRRVVAAPKNIAGEGVRAPFPAMKRYLFLYREDREAYVDPDFGWKNRLVMQEKEFPTGTTDWEVLETARSHEVFDEEEIDHVCSDGKLNRRLLRVVQIAREIPI